ncbi:DotU/TssL family secretion system protein [Pseudomonas sp. ZM23]|uniref:DotU/TssL family secretion system protein n=1 Tax=Pseudomonas triclosanedens TaxID=2961893 RepID=A0ABY6ZSE4_9PSED|nr:DotU/TssL family secretion system protein [Pseudomonas triclosanedens]MCP8467013.1 DotU/TssL family secretion system protein [Pseudomonas triclosanedens]MCP8472839.1 DotU/TssL family secretion system protein [Pseudomonas triclosanedens]MCP8478270.1 DotU/TssL family secretion system protein [Pseudomonas triclosanedens]WAI47675.1 DotU/TssL family secretion system protein [Pseudomonas triclosanedens]
MPEGSQAIYPAAFGEAPLSRAFQAAWVEWRQRWEVLKAPDGDEATASERVADEAQAVVRRLWRSAFAQVGDSAGEQVKAMVYAFVALLDESLLFEPWIGQGTWQERPLEARLYATRNAGERLPQAIHRLLETRSPGTRDLANVYLQCLLLGFHGRLRGPKGEALHEKWRQALFAHAWQRDADTQALLQTLARPASTAALRMPLRRALPDGLRLVLAVTAGVLLLIVIGQWLWSDIQGELDPVLEQANASLMMEVRA